ncbi:hypothetical protein [Thermaerobacter sp. FW80]|uniref:hypothetical protein n=1 Tax=Thermaerobacter sp. FW80 TaxID=2546351 RepID=UPI0014316B45|nr:hypothetical protein [Thermaerobacter sp. FW80]
MGVVQFQTLVRGVLVSTVAVPDHRVAETLVVPLDQRGRPCWGAPLVERRYPERIDVAGLEAAHAAMVAAVEEGRYDAPAEGAARRAQPSPSGASRVGRGSVRGRAFAL